MSENRPSKTEYYLNIAKAVSLRSTCLRRQYGAGIVEVINANSEPRCTEKDLARVEKIDHGNFLVQRSRAFGDSGTEYYELLIDIVPLKKGAIFYYDPYDYVRGSVSLGCIKLAWTKDGGCYSMYCANTFVMHANTREDTSLLKRV